MLRSITKIAGTLLAIGSATLANTYSASGSTLGTDRPAVAAPLKPPVIHENFTLLPCNQNTTIGLEGCFDHRIDAEVAVIFGLLSSNPYRRDLTAAQGAWLAYRSADCQSQSDAYGGGSEATVLYASCLASSDQARITDLHGFYKVLTQGMSKAPAFP
jgi:hypothetical protein